MDDIVKDFLIENRENLDGLDQELVKLESDPSSKERLGSIFRTIHTIKGSCGFLGFARLEKLAHAGENLLSRLRDGELRLTEEVTSGLLAMVDAVRLMLAAIERTEKDGDEDYALLIEQLAALQRPTSAGTSTFAELPSQIAATACQETGADSTCPELLPSISDHEIADRPKIDATPEAARETIRVGVYLLDRLMNLVGELVLARNQLLQLTNRGEDDKVQAVSQRINRITTELQAEVMKTRMQPIGSAWNKFPRTVRDLALNCGKDVRLEMQGQDRELDRSILEAIRDPLTHLVRNSIDHGIELPEARKQAGKEAAGVLRLRAFHAGGQVNIEVSDDGAGLNRERIVQKAIERGLVSAAQAAHLPDRDLFNLIFLPGFSTAEKVTAVSGRGVGMDVVKTSIEKIGGAVEVQSASGKGTTVRIKIPLTLAIIPALMVNSGGERFAIPQASVRELVRHDASAGGPGVEMVHAAPVYRLRGRLLPLVYLSRELGLGRDFWPTNAPDSSLNIVVVEADGHEFGLVVDEIVDREEIVVKPLGKQLKGIPAFSGATILGDGRVALILDIPGLAQSARIISEASESAANDSERSRASEQPGCRRQSLLVVECRNRARMAIPLPLVARLEELPATAVEVAGTQEVTQYRGGIMPLVRLSRLISPAAPECEAAASGPLQVVVYSESVGRVGLIVDRIVDIVNEDLVVHSPKRPGVLGSSIIQGRITELLDLPHLVHEIIPAATAAGA